MKDEKLKGCPISGCGGEGTYTKRGKVRCDSSGSCLLAYTGNAMSEPVWQALPRASESVLEVVCDECLSPLAYEDHDRVRVAPCARCIESPAPRMGAPGDVWVVRAADGEIARILARQPDYVGTEQIVQRHKVIGAPSKGDCEGCETHGLKCDLGAATDQLQAALQRAETAERRLEKDGEWPIDLAAAGDAVVKAEKVRDELLEALTRREGEKRTLAAERDGFLERAEKAKAERDSALAGEAKARTARDASRNAVATAQGYIERLEANQKEACHDDRRKDPDRDTRTARTTPAPPKPEPAQATTKEARDKDGSVGPAERAETLIQAREEMQNWHFKHPSHERGGIGRFAAHLLEWAEETDRRRADARRQLGKCFVEGRDEAQLVLAVNELIGEL